MDGLILVTFNNSFKLIKLNPLNPAVHFWLHHTAHCAVKIVSVCLCVGSSSAESVVRVEMGGDGWGRERMTCRVTCTWWLLCLAVKVP